MTTRASLIVTAIAVTLLFLMGTVNDASARGGGGGRGGWPGRRRRWRLFSQRPRLERQPLVQRELGLLAKVGAALSEAADCVR